MADPFDLAGRAHDERGRDAPLPRSLHVVVRHRTVRVGGEEGASGDVGVGAVAVGLRLQKRFDGLEVFVAYADDRHALVDEALLELGEVRHARPTRRAPRGPELDHGDLAWLERCDRDEVVAASGPLHPVLDVEHGGAGSDRELGRKCRAAEGGERREGGQASHSVRGIEFKHGDAPFPNQT